MEDCDASAFSLARFGIGTVIATLYTPSIGPFLNRVFDDRQEQEDNDSKDADAFMAWKWGLEIGM